MICHVDRLPIECPEPDAGISDELAGLIASLLIGAVERDEEAAEEIPAQEPSEK